MKSICFFLCMAVFVATSHAGSLPKVAKVLNCSFNRNRIIIYEYSNSPSAEEMKAFSKKIIEENTTGRFTTAYFFKKGKTVPRSAQNMCESISKANEILYESAQINSWDFAYMQDVSGKKVFFDCRSDKKSDICRQ